MKQFTVAAALVVLAGCASTTADVAATAPYVFHSEQAMELAARCIIKTIDERYGSMDARLLETGSRPGIVEIRVREPDAGVAAMIEIEPAEKGAKIIVRISNQFLYPPRDVLAKRIVGEC